MLSRGPNYTIKVGGPITAAESLARLRVNPSCSTIGLLYPDRVLCLSLSGGSDAANDARARIEASTSLWVRRNRGRRGFSVGPGATFWSAYARPEPKAGLSRPSGLFGLHQQQRAERRFSVG